MKRALLIAGGTIGGLGAVLSITPPQLGSPVSSNLSGIGAGTTNAGTVANASGQTPTAGPQAATPVATPVSTTPSTQQSSQPSAKPSKTKKSTNVGATKQPAPAPTKTHAVTGNSASPTPTQTQPQSAAPTPTPTKTQTPTPTPTPTKTQAPAPKGVSGTFTGATFQANQQGRVWGNVQVTVTLVDGAISNIQASQNPQSRGIYAFNWLTPAIKNQNLTVKDVMGIKPSSLLGSNSGASYSAVAYMQSLQSALTKSGA